MKNTQAFTSHPTLRTLIACAGLVGLFGCSSASSQIAIDNKNFTNEHNRTTARLNSPAKPQPATSIRTPECQSVQIYYYNVVPSEPDTVFFKDLSEQVTSLIAGDEHGYSDVWGCKLTKVTLTAHVDPAQPNNKFEITDRALKIVEREFLNRVQSGLEIVMINKSDTEPFVVYEKGDPFEYLNNYVDARFEYEINP